MDTQELLQKCVESVKRYFKDGSIMNRFGDDIEDYMNDGLRDCSFVSGGFNFSVTVNSDGVIAATENILRIREAYIGEQELRLITSSDLLNTVNYHEQNTGRPSYLVHGLDQFNQYRLYPKPDSTVQVKLICDSIVDEHNISFEVAEAVCLYVIFRCLLCDNDKQLVEVYQRYKNMAERLCSMRTNRQKHKGQYF